MNQTRTLYVYLLLSCIAAILITSFVVTTPLDVHPLPFLEKVGIAGVFIISCIGGISLVIRPNWVRRYFPKSENQENTNGNEGKRAFRGHHPDCTPFQNHTIHWRGKTWCAGCLGLFIGLCASLLLMILYIVTDLHLTKITSYLFLALGFLIITSVFLEGFHPSKRPMVHVLSNSILPVSFSLITITVGGMTGTFVNGFFTILLCFLWLDTRVYLSKWRHRVLCASCSESCKMYPVVV